MAAATGNKPHVLAVPLPAQGHVKPLMNLCRQIAKHGIKVTFVNSQFIHETILSAAKPTTKNTQEEEVEEEEEEEESVVMLTVPDGITEKYDPNVAFTLTENLPKTMPETLRDLISQINSSNPNQRVSCVLADLSFSWIFDIADSMGAEAVGFSPPSVASLAVVLHAHTLLKQGDLSDNGLLMKGEAVSLSTDIPAWRKEELPWCFPAGDPEMKKILFDMVKGYTGATKAKLWLCNSCHELEPGVARLLPNALPVGPLNLLGADGNATRSCSRPTSFYPEDSSCLNWLDSKQDGSVIYVSFGSLAVFSQQQLGELALALELSGRPFLWVVRPDIANGSQFVYPDGFLKRVGELGKIVEWVPQDRVLSHPSVGCFVSHCGWNSTLEGVSRGVPFLCWPCFGDQLHNARYICDKWETGLKINFDEDGMKWRHEIKKKIDMLFCDIKFKENALKMKGMCGKSVSEGGSSQKNLEKFIDHLRK